MTQKVLLRVLATPSWCNIYIFRPFVDQVDADLQHLLRAFLYYILCSINFSDNALRGTTIAVQELVNDILGRGNKWMTGVIAAHITL